MERPTKFGGPELVIPNVDPWGREGSQTTRTELENTILQVAEKGIEPKKVHPIVRICYTLLEFVRVCYRISNKWAIRKRKEPRAPTVAATRSPPRRVLIIKRKFIPIYTNVTVICISLN